MRSLAASVMMIRTLIFKMCGPNCLALDGHRSLDFLDSLKYQIFKQSRVSMQAMMDMGLSAFHFKFPG